VKVYCFSCEAERRPQSPLLEWENCAKQEKAQRKKKEAASDTRISIEGKKTPSAAFESVFLFE
jgi:hypothetical protein